MDGEPFWLRGRCAARMTSPFQPSHFQIYADARNEWRWRLLAENGKSIAASSEGYMAKADAMNGIDIVRRWDGVSTLYQDGGGEWRWRLVHANGKIIATSGEGYVAKADCEYGMSLTEKLAKVALVKDA